MLGSDAGNLFGSGIAQNEIAVLVYHRDAIAHAVQDQLQNARVGARRRKLPRCLRAGLRRRQRAHPSLITGGRASDSEILRVNAYGIGDLWGT